MIKSLFERREEYFNKKPRGSGILRIIGGAAVPLAAAAAVALTIVGIQRNADIDDIVITGDVNDTGVSGTAGIANETDSTDTEPIENSGFDPHKATVAQLQKNFWENTDAMGTNFVSAFIYHNPEFIIAENKLCKLVGGRGDMLTSASADMAMPDLSAEAYTGAAADDCVYIRSGLCDILPPSGLTAEEQRTFNTYCTFYTCAENNMYKAAFINNILCIFYEIGDATYEVEGVKYKIASTHLSPAMGGATEELIGEENGISIYKMYDADNHLYLTDRFALYSDTLVNAVGGYRLWETAPLPPAETILQSSKDAEPCTNAITFDQLSYIMETINSGAYDPQTAMENIEKILNTQNDRHYFRLYYNNSSADYVIDISAADTLSTEYKNLITGEIRTDLSESYKELDDRYVVFEMPSSPENTEPVSISYKTLKKLAELAGSGRLTTDYLTEKGAVSDWSWEYGQYGYTFQYEYNSQLYYIQCWADIDFNIETVTIIDTYTCESLDLTEKAEELDKYLERPIGKNYIYSGKQFLELMDKIDSNTLTVEYMSEIAEDFGSGAYVYSLYYGSEYNKSRYYRIGISMGGDNNVMSAWLTDMRTGNSLNLLKDFCQYNYFMNGQKQVFKTGFTPDVDLRTLDTFTKMIKGRISEERLKYMGARERTEDGMTVYYFYHSSGDKMFTVETTVDPSIPVTQWNEANIVESWLIDTDTGDKINLMLNAYTIDKLLSGAKKDDIERLDVIDKDQFDMLIKQFVPENDASDSLTDLIKENFPYIQGNDNVLTFVYERNGVRVRFYYYRYENILRIETPEDTYQADVYSDIEGLVRGVHLMS